MKRYPLMEIKEFLQTTFRVGLFDEKINIANFTQFQIVKYILEHDGERIYQKDFERALNIRKSTISGILDTMEKNKIITRISSQKDGRGKLIILNETFESSRQAIIMEMKRIEDLVIKDITQEDLEVFYKVLDKMKENIMKEGRDIND